MITPCILSQLVSTHSLKTHASNMSTFQSLRNTCSQGGVVIAHTLHTYHTNVWCLTAPPRVPPGRPPPSMIYETFSKYDHVTTNIRRVMPDTPNELLQYPKALYELYDGGRGIPGEMSEKVQFNLRRFKGNRLGSC